MPVHEMISASSGAFQAPSPLQHPRESGSSAFQRFKTPLMDRQTTEGGSASDA